MNEVKNALEGPNYSRWIYFEIGKGAFLRIPSAEYGSATAPSRRKDEVQLSGVRSIAHLYQLP